MSDPVVGRALPFKARGPFRGIRAPFRGIGVWGRYPARTNSIRNNTMQGAVAGSPGTLPTNWGVSGFSGLTREIVGTGTTDGLPYIEISYSGTASGVFGDLYFDSNTGIAATNEQQWVQSVWAYVVAGSLTNISSASLALLQYNSTPSSLGSTTNGAMSAAIGSEQRRVSRVHTTNNAATVSVRPYIGFGITNGGAVNFTLRIVAPQLELGRIASGPILTSGAAASRVADTLAGAY